MLHNFILNASNDLKQAGVSGPWQLIRDDNSRIECNRRGLSTQASTGAARSSSFQHGNKNVFYLWPSRWDIYFQIGLEFSGLGAILTFLPLAWLTYSSIFRKRRRVDARPHKVSAKDVSCVCRHYCGYQRDTSKWIAEHRSPWLQGPVTIGASNLGVLIPSQCMHTKAVTSSMSHSLQTFCWCCRPCCPLW